MPAPRTPLSRNAAAGHGTRWGRAAAVAVLLGAALPGAPSRAEEDPAWARRLLLASVATDPEGKAERMARKARVALSEDRPQDAFAWLVRLAEEHGETLLPLAYVLEPGTLEADAALRWPARRAANLALVRLPEGPRRRLRERWGPDAGVLAAKARRGDEAALGVLAEKFGALPEGGRALRTLARLDVEAGRYADAVRRLEEWTWLRPEAPPAVLAAAVAEWVHALRALDDAGGVLALARRFAGIAEQPVALGGRRTTLDRLFWRKRAKPAPPPAARPALPEDLVTVWSRGIEDPTRYGESWDDPDPPRRVVTAGARVLGDAIVLHAGRSVVRLDARTGLEAWRFPRRPLPMLPKASARYLWQDIPVRSVTRSGDEVLVVIGEPGASGSYQWRDEIQEASSLRDELRLRLVALDVETGALRWSTGRHDETHPVLGHLATGVASPPLVVGDRVYVGLAQRVGTGGYHLACLARETGRPIWVRRLGDGTSGRAPDRSDDDRFRHPNLQSLAWGARPTLADGELCYLPHAGMAAGLEAATGQLRWVRALPRYGLAVRHDAGVGPSARNVPIAWGDAWILAPMDCPQLLCLARGTGTLRWMRGPRSPSDLPVWRDLHAVSFDPGGRPAVFLSTQQTGIVLDARGVPRQPLNGVDLDLLTAGWTPDGGRGYVEHGVHVRAERGQLVASGFFRGDGDGLPRAQTAIPYTAPDSADVYPLEGGWLLVGVKRVAVVAEASAARAWLDETPARHPSDAHRAAAAVRAAVRARLQTGPDLIEAALDRWDAVGESKPKRAAATRIAEELTLWLDDVWGMADEETTKGLAQRWIKVLAPQLWRLPASLRGEGLYYAARAWLALGRGPEAVLLLDRWIAEADETLVPLDPVPHEPSTIHVRGDLLARHLLQLARTRHPSSRAALQRRERRHMDTIDALREAPERALRMAIRRAGGTEAAAVGRRHLADRLAAEGRHSEAASLRADLRLDPSPRELATPTRLRRGLARLQTAEAELLVRASEPAQARSLLVDAERWAPPGLRDGRGRTLGAAVEALRASEGRRPRRRGPGRATLDVWGAGGPGPETDQVASVLWTGLHGPGSGNLGDTVLLVRGLTPELWSLGTGRRLATLPGDDQGWFGGRLQSVDVRVPGGGILVSSIVAGEPADSSKVQAGDWVRAWAGRPVPDLPSFIRAVAASQPGAWTDVEVWRHGQPTLERFRAGRRPLDQPPRRTKDAYSRLWVDAAGRILFPTRSGLDWIDPEARTRTALWRWNEPGTVLRCDVFGGEAFVTIERAGFDDVVVALDLDTGGERWRRALEGSIQRTQAAGSALWVDTTEPGHAYALDRADGSVRVAVRTMMTRRDEYRRTWTVSYVSDASPAGRGFAVIGHRSRPELVCLNTTTGVLEWGRRVGGKLPRRARGAGFLDPSLMADAVVAVVDSADALQVVVPDPLGRPPGEEDVLQAGPNALRTDSSDHGGAFSDDARVFVYGNVIHIVRNLRGRVTLWTVFIDFEELAQRRTGQPAGDPVVMRINERMLSDAPGGRHFPYVVDAFADHDGMYVLGATFGDEPWMEVRYASENGSVRMVNSVVVEARRHRPVRFGDLLVVPTDRGAEIFPLVN